MYRSFSIKNFRCFDELTVEGMGRINLIAGKNNVGKTALLEALWVHSGTADPERALRLHRGRGIGTGDPEGAINNLFLGFNASSTIELCARGDWGHRERQLEMYVSDPSIIQLSFDSPEDEQLQLESSVPRSQLIMNYSEETGSVANAKGRLVRRAGNAARGDVSGGWDISIEEQSLSGIRPSPAVFLRAAQRNNNSENAYRYSRLEINGKEDGVVQILQEVEPALKRLTVVATGTDTRIYADIGSKPLIPIQLMGDGMSRILSVALAIASVPGGMVLVDEIENGIHYTVMEKVWKAIGDFARSYDVQLFATTHSRECVYYAHKAFEADEEEELRFFRIDRAYGKLRTVMYDKEVLNAALEAGLGIR